MNRIDEILVADSARRSGDPAHKHRHEGGVKTTDVVVTTPFHTFRPQPTMTEEGQATGLLPALRHSNICGKILSMPSRSKPQSKSVAATTVVRKGTAGHSGGKAISMDKPHAISFAATVVVRDKATGRLTVGGTDERKLVNKHSSIAVKSAPAMPKHFTESQIREITKRMKVA